MTCSGKIGNNVEDADDKLKIVIILGPTASGKTDCAVRLAERFGGEIVNADGVGKEDNASCGDLTVCYVKLSGGRLSDVKFKTYGCGVAIAVSFLLERLLS